MFLMDLELDEHTRGNTQKKNALFLSLAYFLSVIGDGVRTVVLPLIVLDITNSTYFMGLVFSIETMVFIVCGMFSGAIADRMNKKYLLIGSDISRAILVLSIIPIGSGYPQFFKIWVLIVAVLMSFAETFFRPAFFALVPEIVDEKDIDRFNSLLTTLSKGGDIIGFSLGGVLYNTLKINALLVDGLSFLASAAIIGTIAVTQKPMVGSNRNILKDLKEGMVFIGTNGFIRSILYYGLLMNFFSAPIMITMPALAKVLFPEKSGYVYGLMKIGSSAGVIIAGILLLSLKKINRKTLFVLGITGEGVAMLLLGSLQPISGQYELILLILIAMNFILGVSVAILNIPITSWLQIYTPQEMRGKVKMINDVILSVPIAVSPPLFGYVLEKINIFTLLIFMGAMMTIIGFSAYFNMVEPEKG